MAARRLLAVLLFSSLLTMLWARESSASRENEPELVPAREIDGQWILGICQPHIEESIDPSLELLVAGFQSRFLSLFLGRSGIRERTEAEISGIEVARTQEELAKIERSLVATMKERDLLVFRGFENWKYRSELSKAEASLRQHREDLGREGLKRYVVPESASLSFPEHNRNGSYLERPQDADFKKFSVDNKLDALLLSSFSQTHGYVIFQWSVYSPWADEIIDADEIIFSRSSRDEVATESVRWIISRLTNTALSHIRLTSLEAEDHIELDRVRIPVEEAQNILLEAGTHLLTIDRKGSLPLTATLAIKGGEDLVLRPVMMPVKEYPARIEVSTDTGIPLEGARIEINSEFAGYSPLNTVLPAGETLVLSVLMTGYEDRSALLEISEESSIVFSLPAINPGRRTVKDTRKSFYWAFGWFFLSIPVSLILTGINASFEEAWVRTGNSVYYPGSSISNITMWASWTISTALFGNTVFRLVHYLNASNQTGISRYNDRGLSSGKKRIP